MHYVQELAQEIIDSLPEGGSTKNGIFHILPIYANELAKLQKENFKRSIWREFDVAKNIGVEQGRVKLIQPVDAKRIRENAMQILDFFENYIEKIPASQVDNNAPSSSSLWEKNKFRLFLSHDSADKDLAHRIKDKLEKFAIFPFVAHDDIVPSREWLVEIESALRSMDCLLALITTNFHSKDWTDQEVGAAIGRDVLILPLTQGIQPYGFMGKYQGLPISSKTDEQIAIEIVSCLLQNNTTRTTLSDAIITQFEKSMNYEEAQRNFLLLDKLPFWDEISIERVITASEKNSQISGAYYIRQRFDNFIKKIKGAVSH